MRTLTLALLVSAGGALAQPLAGTQPLTLEGDPAAKMVGGISAYLLRATEATVANRHPDRERLKRILGVVEARVPFAAPELLATTDTSARVAESASYAVYSVRWPVLAGVTAEGLLFAPARAPKARVVALPDAGEQPEDFTAARRLAENGCQVLVPVLIDRSDTYAGNPAVRMTNQPDREFIYRMSFPVGRTIVGYEVQKVLAAVDWFEKENAREKVPIAVWGYGEGGLIAFDAAALDSRIDAAAVSGYFQPREALWKEPIYRNVWRLLLDFGDAEMARLVAPRTLIIETRPGPVVTGPPPPRPGRSGAAPGMLAPASEDAVRREFDRARATGDHMQLAAGALRPFLKALGIEMSPPGPAPKVLVKIDREARLHRQFRELVDYNQNLAREAWQVRDKLWGSADASSPERWRESAKPLRDRVWNEMIGRLPPATLPVNPRTRLSYRDARWNGYEVMLDVYPDVFAYGVLLLPKDIRPGERRPVVVVQHGLEGRAQHLFGQPEVDRTPDGKITTFHYYQNIGSKLADMGFVVYSPQNPYIGDFRVLQRQANPLGLSIFSFILAQHDRLLDWLTSLPFVDARRIGFYGLSYGGKTALRVPPLLDRYALSICSGDFNEWLWKLTSVDRGLSYMYTQEYEMDEWDLGHVANHAELAMLMAPRPFMVERGHRDAVGIDEWVAYEYARVRRLYDEMGIGERTRIEYFNGPHMIHGKGTVEFLKQFLAK